MSYSHGFKSRLLVKNIVTMRAIGAKEMDLLNVLSGRGCVSVCQRGCASKDSGVRIACQNVCAAKPVRGNSFNQ